MDWPSPAGQDSRAEKGETTPANPCSRVNSVHAHPDMGDPLRIPPIVNGGWAVNSTAWILEESKKASRVLPLRAYSSPNGFHLLTWCMLHVLALYFPRSRCTVAANAPIRPSHAMLQCNWLRASLYNHDVCFPLPPCTKNSERKLTYRGIWSGDASCRASFTVPRTRWPMKRAYDDPSGPS